MKSLNCLVDLGLYQTVRTISNASPRSMKHWLINHQLKNMSTKFRTGLHSRINVGIISNSWRLFLKLFGGAEGK